MGEFISIRDSLIISLFSIIVIFIVLVVISIFISLLKNFDRKVEDPMKASEENINNIKEKSIKEKEAVQNIVDEELIAVISAAVAASLGVSLLQINIKNIKRVNNNSSVWAIAGKQEQLYSKL